MSSAHAVVFLYPLQGHIIPTYKLAMSLAAQDLLVTVVCTHECHARIVKANNGRDPFAANACNIRSALVSDRLPQDLDRSLNHDDFMDALFCKMQPHVEELMEDLQRKGPPITCFIADTFFVWADRIAKNLESPSFLSGPSRSWCSPSTTTSTSSSKATSETLWIKLKIPC